jgi:hypothetical protein
MAGLMSYGFPGNIRELENVVEHSFVLCQGRVIERKDLPEIFRAGGTSNHEEGGEFRTLKEMEAMMIEQALRRHDGNRAAAARELDIDSEHPLSQTQDAGLVSVIQLHSATTMAGPCIALCNVISARGVIHSLSKFLHKTCNGLHLGAIHTSQGLFWHDSCVVGLEVTL